MSALNTKNIIIVEGSDASGKSSLCKFLQDKVEGKCHTIHSNYSKLLPKENHRKQHFLISKFVSRQFDKKHYTGNKLVILDRSYISDIVYGQISYGSKGSLQQKYETLNKLFKILTKNKDVTVSVIYCRPEKTNFEECLNQREELLNSTENNIIQRCYDKFFESYGFTDIIIRNGVNYYTYSFTSDPEYKDLLKQLDLNDWYDKEYSSYVVK